MSLTTKSWTYNAAGYPSCLRLTSLPTPSTLPSEHHFLLQPRAAALNPVDIQLMNLPIWALPLPLHPFNAQPGRGVGEDFAGVVTAAGKETGLTAGDEVFGLSFPLGKATTGVLTAQAACLDIRRSCVASKPRGWSWAQAASLPLVWLTARTIVEAVSAGPRRAGVASSSARRVVVLGGSSSTGMYMVAQARKRGWKILATCSGRNTEFVHSMGADEVVDYTTSSVPDAVRAFKADAVLDCVGGTDCIGLAPYYVTIVGDKHERSAMGGSMTYLWNPRMFARWAWGRFGLGYKYDCLNIEFNKEWLEEAFGLEPGQITIDSQFEFEQAKEAFERMNTGRARGKVVVKMEAA